jgi:hypothetical protein
MKKEGDLSVMLKAQISVEYMILTGFILMVVIIPSTYLVFSLANEGVYGTMNNQRSIDLGKGLIESAKQMYYLGLYSKKTADYDVPNNVNRMFILQLKTATDQYYYYFGIIFDDGNKVTEQMFLSDVPILSELGAYVDNDDSNLYITECEPPSIYVCTYYNFKQPVINSGRKTFKIETKYNSDLDQSVVNIIPVID